MAKKKPKKSKISTEVTSISILAFLPPPPEVHPNEDQEDPINGKFAKSIVIEPWGPEWR